MAQGHGDEGEPNLIPLLDLVLQLIMFFMITVNFIRVEQLPDDVDLPLAQGAVPLDRTADEWVYLNMTRDGYLVQSPDSDLSEGGQQAFPGKHATLGKIEIALRQIKKDLEAKARERDPKAPPPKIVIILRAHRDASCRAVWAMLDTCKKAGYQHRELRVLQKG